MIEFVVLFAVAAAIGHLLIRYPPAHLEAQLNVAYKSAMRGLFYAPTLVVGGHGIGPVPTIVGLAMAPFDDWILVFPLGLVPAILVFSISVFASDAAQQGAPGDGPRPAGSDRP